ncbi:putative ER lumen protein retaining receptor [Zostera marina]|uniref:Putative ER lumen protein retaining receptor n=1 Tax=Zostera marina TaxID=29655 RepID=A0A0K9NQF4_ZOSMR|nr:putative ER lumen protein retaining receptor [Zostera marina]
MGYTKDKRKGVFQGVGRWIRRQSPRVKTTMGVFVAVTSFIFLWLVVHNHDNLFVISEVSHFIGIAFLIYKLFKERTCAGLSLKTQVLTAIFLAFRLYCSLIMEYDIHTLLDTATLVTTLVVIFMIRFKLKSTYMADKDTISLLLVIIPCAVLAFLIHPQTNHYFVNRLIWAFSAYLETVSILPQLRVMQNTKIVESFTANYVFALGVARFLACANWILHIIDSGGSFLTRYGNGYWPPMVVLCEMIQTFIFTDFCYYYVKSVMGGDLLLRLPSGVV